MSTDQRRAPWRCWRETIGGEVHCSLPIDRCASDPPPRPRRRPRRPARVFRRAHRGPRTRSSRAPASSPRWASTATRSTAAGSRRATSRPTPSASHKRWSCQPRISTRAHGGLTPSSPSGSRPTRPGAAAPSRARRRVSQDDSERGSRERPRPHERSGRTARWCHGDGLQVRGPRSGAGSACCAAGRRSSSVRRRRTSVA